MNQLAVPALRFAVLLASLAPLSAAGQILYTWPSTTFPCDTTLQACVSAAGPDDGVEIATNEPIAETITKMGAVDLHAAPGFEPVFAAGHDISLGAASGAGAQLIRVRGLTLTDGRITVSNVFLVPMTARILDNTILAHGLFAAIGVESSGAGPLTFEVAGNDVSTSAGAEEGIRVLVQNGFATGDVVDNVVTLAAASDQTGVLLDVEDGALFVDVVRNRIAGDGYAHGIRHRLIDAAVLDARVLGNLVVGASAGGAGIAVEGFGADEVLDARIVNNTVAGSASGILVAGVDAEVANNAIASNDTGLAVDSDGATNSHNLFHDNATDLDGAMAGAGTVFDDPRFVGADDFRLGPGSAAIDAGDSTAVPPELATDLAGEARIVGLAVDIGAYEVPEPSAALTAAASLAALGLCGHARARRRLA